jgi:hypothetical protein
LIEERVFEHEAFIKHIDVAKRPEYISSLIENTCSSYIATDYTTFEALFTKQIMVAVEMQLYEYMVQDLPEGKEWYKWVRKAMLGDNVCLFKHLGVTVPCTRMSGEMSTSLGNGFSNLMFMLFLCEQKKSKAVGVVEGDDGLFAVHGPAPTEKDFEELGLIIKLETHQFLSHASFCGLVFDPVDMNNITDPRKVIVNFGWINKRYVGCRKRQHLALLRCKSYSLIAQYPGCPILQELGLYGLRVTEGVRDYDMVRVINRMDGYDRDKAFRNWVTPRVRPIGDNTRCLMSELYGISIREQLDIEERISAMSKIEPLNFPGFEDACPDSWKDYWNNYVAVDEAEVVQTEPHQYLKVKQKLLDLFQ